MTGRRFYKTNIVVTVLSKTPLDTAIVTDGIKAYFSPERLADVEVTGHTIDGKGMAEALHNHGNGPELFNLDFDGDEVCQCGEKSATYCDICDRAFCGDCGQVGGDRQVQDVGAVAYPSVCDPCREGNEA